MASEARLFPGCGLYLDLTPKTRAWCHISLCFQPPTQPYLPSVKSLAHWNCTETEGTSRWIFFSPLSFLLWLQNGTGQQAVMHHFLSVILECSNVAEERREWDEKWRVCSVWAGDLEGLLLPCAAMRRHSQSRSTKTGYVGAPFQRCFLLLPWQGLFHSHLEASRTCIWTDSR